MRGNAQSSLVAGSSSDTNTPFTLTGTVVNGLNGAVVPRALVRINSRAEMTDGQGRFNFPSFVGTTGSVQVTKPGYWNSPDDPSARPSQTLDLTGRIELKLYPDAVIMGLVTGSDRLPAEHAQVILQRESVDESGARGFPAAFSQTDSHGEYRFNVPPGHYRISIGYSQRPGVDGTVMLPVDYPESGGTEALPFFAVSSNEERRIDLHPRTAVAVSVRFRVEGDEAGANPRVMVKSSTGASFSVYARFTREPGVLEVSLPAGNYHLRAIQQNRESRQEAEANVVVGSRPVEGLQLNFGAVPVIPVELTFEPTAATASAAAAQPPRLNNLGLRLQNSSRSDQFGGDDVGLTSQGEAQPTLQVSPGVYRLRSLFAAQWYVRSASYGNADLLTQPLNVSNGAGGEPLRIILANDLGQVSGTVTGAATRTVCYVYLLAHQPSLTPVVQVQTDQNGLFGRMVQPGSYTVHAFPRRFPGDLHDPEVVRHLGAGTEVTVPASGKTTIELPVQNTESAR